MFKSYLTAIIYFILLSLSLQSYSSEKNRPLLSSHLVTKIQVKDPMLLGFMFNDIYPHIYTGNEPYSSYLKELASGSRYFDNCMLALELACDLISTSKLDLDGIRKIISVSSGLVEPRVAVNVRKARFGLHSKFLKLEPLSNLSKICPHLLFRKNHLEDDGPWFQGEVTYDDEVENLKLSDDILAYRGDVLFPEVAHFCAQIEKYCADYLENGQISDLCQLVQYMNSNHLFGDGHGRATMILIQAHLILHEEGRVAFWYNHNPNGLSTKQYVRMIRFGQEMVERINRLAPEADSRALFFKEVQSCCQLNYFLENGFYRLIKGKKNSQEARLARKFFLEKYPGFTLREKKIRRLSNIFSLKKGFVLNYKGREYLFFYRHFLSFSPFKSQENINTALMKIKAGFSRLTRPTKSFSAKK